MRATGDLDVEQSDPILVLRVGVDMATRQLELRYGLGLTTVVRHADIRNSVVSVMVGGTF
jgi:hypothetical protein